MSDAKKPEVAVKKVVDLYKTVINGITLGEVELPKGAGSGVGSRKLCVMQVFNVAAHGLVGMKDDQPTDSPLGACPILREVCISVNDGLAEGPRQRFKEYVPRLIAAETSEALQKARRRVLNRWKAKAKYDDSSGFFTTLTKTPLEAFRLIDELLLAKP